MVVIIRKQLISVDNLICKNVNFFIFTIKTKHYAKYWKTSGEFNTKIIIIPELTDDQNHFITFDIRPKGSKQLQYYRFAYEYNNPKDILKGLEHFRKTYEFVNKDEINPEPIRKQKRND